MRVYHGGRDRGHRARERALVQAGADVTLVVPARWPEGAAEERLSPEPFAIVELAVARPGDVNRHGYRDPAAIRRVLEQVRPDVLDIHEEPFSVAARQWLAAAPEALPIAMYTAQNIDKRLPPPFSGYERRAYARVDGLYPCSRQAASVARGKGFSGLIEVLPLGYDETVHEPGAQSAAAEEVVLGLVGRLVPEKGVGAAVDVLAAVNRVRPARLLVVGQGPAEEQLRRRAAELGVGDRVELVAWRPAPELAAAYRQMHVLLVPSTATPSWAEQFGRVLVEAQASGAVVAAFASGAIPEVGGAPAVLAPEGDAHGLAGAVVAVLADPEEFERRRAAGIELAATRTWARVGELQAACYERVRARETRPRPSGRSAARAEFGPTAATPAGRRPFALPLLRRAGRAGALLGAAADLATRVSRRPG